MKRTEPGRDAAIVAQFKDGETLRVIGDRFGLSFERVRQIAKASGAPTRHSVVRAKYEKVAELLVDSDTLTMKEAARSVDVDYINLARYMTLMHPGWHSLRVDRKRDARLSGVGEHTCPSCGVTKSWAEFSFRYDHGSYDRGYRCRACAAEQTKAWNRRNKNRTPEPTVTEKRCPRCGMSKPAGDFSRSRRTFDGLQTYCKLCQREQYRTAWEESKWL